MAEGKDKISIRKENRKGLVKQTVEKIKKRGSKKDPHHTKTSRELITNTGHDIDSQQIDADAATG